MKISNVSVVIVSKGCLDSGNNS